MSIKVINGVEVNMNSGLTSPELEVIITFCRLDNKVEIYTSDPLIAIKALKNDQYKLESQDRYGYWFKVDKKFFLKNLFRNKRRVNPEHMENMRKLLEQRPYYKTPEKKRK